MALDLVAAKAHLNVTTDVDNALITRLIAASQDWLESQLGYKLADKYPDAGSPAVSTVPAALDQAQLMLLAHWYANREATLVGVSASEAPLGVNEIVCDYRNWSWGEADA